jgi:hypothetical protein
MAHQQRSRRGSEFPLIFGPGSTTLVESSDARLGRFSTTAAPEAIASRRHPPDDPLHRRFAKRDARPT